MISIGLAKIEEFRFRVVQMEREVLKEKTRSRALADELEVPMNVHRFDVIYSTCRKYSFSIFFFLLRVYFCMYAYMYINICICKHTTYIHQHTYIQYIHTYIKRWRILESSDPKRYEKVLQVQQLQKQLIEFSDKVTQIDLLIQVNFYLLICMKKSDLFIMYMCMCGV